MYVLRLFFVNIETNIQHLLFFKKNCPSDNHTFEVGEGVGEEKDPFEFPAPPHSRPLAQTPICF